MAEERQHGEHHPLRLLVLDEGFEGRSDHIKMAEMVLALICAVSEGRKSKSGWGSTGVGSGSKTTHGQ